MRNWLKMIRRKKSERGHYKNVKGKNIMATKSTKSTKTSNQEIIEIKPVERLSAEVTIVGDTPLIVHAWSEKAKREILEAQQNKAKGKKKECRNPVEEFIRSMYWLDGMPDIPENATEEECEKIFIDAIEKGARFGFPAVALKKATTSAAYRQGLTKDKVTANGTFWLFGTENPEFLEIKSDPPEMREDMVKIGMGTADLRYRGVFNNWRATFRIEYLKNGAISLENIVNMINIGGFACGLGEWRTEKGGMHGAYHVLAE